MTRQVLTRTTTATLMWTFLYTPGIRTDATFNLLCDGRTIKVRIWVFVDTFLCNIKMYGWLLIFDVNDKHTGNL